MAGETEPKSAVTESKPIKVLVVVEGGVIQAVLSSHPGVEVEVRDWDNKDEENQHKLAESNDEKTYPYEIH